MKYFNEYRIEMIRNIGLFLLLLTGGLPYLNAQTVKSFTEKEAREMFRDAPSIETNTPYRPTSHPEAQWYNDAKFGLFIHWGIYSVKALRPSWGIYHNRFAGKSRRDIGVDEYYDLAKEFNPEKFDADKWMEIAKMMGMEYVVLTTKHHDGYCLWPSEYGDYNTSSGANGRDLVGEFVAAARGHGLKIGFYFSPRDWGYNNHQSGFDASMRKFDGNNPREFPYPEEDNLKEYFKWIDFTVGQLSELLTRYGKIDLLWFDGANWEGDVPNSEYGNKVRNWVYTMQPQIVINPRWGTVVNPDYKANQPAGLKKIAESAGDFYTFESHWDEIVNPQYNAGVYEPIWFEFCDIWKGFHWGYGVPESCDADLDNMHAILERLSTLSAFGGNYLLNIGPDSQGEVREDLLAEAEMLGPWIQLRKAAFFGTGPIKEWETLSPVPLTSGGKIYYAHLTGKDNASKRKLLIKITQKPLTVEVLGKPEIELSFTCDTEGLHISLPLIQYDRLGEILVIQYQANNMTKTHNNTQR